MPKKSEFKTVEFFRKVRDKQATMLADKNPKEILDYFSAFHKTRVPLTKRSDRLAGPAA